MLVKEVAKSSAESVLATYWPEDVLPVRPEVIARRLGIDVRVTSLPEDTSGFIRKTSGEDAQIFLEASDSQLRRTFTCAHELGHYIERTEVQKTPDDDFGFVDKRNSRVHDAHEFFANEFAGNLLMPAAKVTGFHEQGNDAIRMAALFGVSIPAMKTRMLKLGLIQ